MELNTISGLAIAGVICSVVLSMGGPIALLIAGRVKLKARISSFFIGAGTYLLFAMLLEQQLHVLVIRFCGQNAPQKYGVFCYPKPIIQYITTGQYKYLMCFFKRLKKGYLPRFSHREMTQIRLNVSSLWFLYFRQERRIACYAENEQEAETRVGVVETYC